MGRYFKRRLQRKASRNFEGIIGFLFRVIFKPSTKKRQTHTPVDNQIEEQFVIGKVKQILDGDGCIVQVDNKEISVRLYAIDCPEYDQPWGDIATAGLIKLIGGKSVILEYHGPCKHGRALATIYLKDGGRRTNVNLKMVQKGHAWVYKQFYDDLPKHRKLRFNNAENFAREKRVGLWKNDEAVAPWTWRKNS